MSYSVREQESVRYQREKDELQSKVNALNQKVATLENEQKEYEMTINELKEQVKKLKVNALDINEFREWDSNDVINWILSIDDGVLAKYEEKVKQEILDGEIEGTDLITMDMDDIKRLGIGKFAHRKVLQTNIAKLKQINDNKQNANNVNNTNNEGANATAYI